ncbi:MAG: carboxypeptidase-like regulatory domain-containing protein, partial [Tannerellaceae bacterium]
MRTKFLTFILAFSTGVCVYAKSGNGKISGIVKDTEGAPLVGANIWNKKYKIGTVTDSNGQFSLHNLPDGELFLDIKY